MAEEFIRSATRASGALTPDEETAMRKISDEWIAIAYKTGRTDKEALIGHIRDLYGIVDHPAPPIAVVPSPYVMAVASVICTRYHRHKAVGAMLKGYQDVQKAFEELKDDAQLSYIKEAVQAVLSLPDTPEGLKDGKKTASNEAISLGDYLQGGNFWPALPAFYSACRDVLGLKLECFEKYPPWENCAKHGGYRWVHEEFCLVCDFPDILAVDEQYRPHNESGPSHAWSDGWKLWYIQGHRVDEQIVMRPKTLTVEQINKESNNDLRAIMLERKGWADYIREAGLEVVGEPNDNAVENTIEVLYQTPFGHKILVATCTTGRLFAMPVRDECNTVAAAREWIHGNKKRNIIART